LAYPLVTIKWQSALKAFELDGHKKLVGGLTQLQTVFGSPEDIEYVFQEPERTPVPRGRRSLVDSSHLHNQREHLVQIFEGYWGEIGWALRKCKKSNDLATAFAPLNGKVSNDLISALLTRSNEAGTTDALAQIRSALRSLAKPARAADELNRSAQARLNEARSALSMKLTRRQRKAMRKEFVDRWKKAQHANRKCQQLNKSEDSLVRQRKLSEASFARREVFRFLESKRYELNPLNLANATAGLPFMGWRQSMRRCSTEDSRAANGTHYQVFKAIRYLISTAKMKTARGLIRHFRNSIPQLPSRYRLARTEIAEQWFFLDRAIRESYRTKVHPREVPFEITRRYFRQRSCRTHIDTLLSERAKLKLRRAAPRGKATPDANPGTD
jgi:hypothetical protein